MPLPAAAPSARPLTVAVTGASGFLGRALVPALAGRGHSVVALSRAPRSGSAAGVAWRAYEPLSAASCRAAVEGADAVVNLAGDAVFGGRWTAAKRERIRSSRVDGTRALVAGMASASRRPAALVSASAIGFYGPRPWEEECGEDAAPGSDFLASVCVAWEAEAAKAQALGARVSVARIGIVLGRGGGALAKMTTPFKLCVGGRLGNGRQGMSWIHLDDLVSMWVAMTEDAAWRGPANATAPNPVTNAAFSKALGHALHRPSFLPTPGFALRLAVGKAAEVLTTGQRVLPRAALSHGFSFRFPTLEPALADLFS